MATEALNYYILYFLFNRVHDTVLYKAHTSCSISLLVCLLHELVQIADIIIYIRQFQNYDPPKRAN